jgi:hypothetical protein
MSTRVQGWVLIVVTAMRFAGPAVAADTAAILKDLTAVIALQGLPCGQIVGVVRQGDNDYIASCQDGNRYRTFVSPQGRVVVQKMQQK